MAVAIAVAIDYLVRLMDFVVLCCVFLSHFLFADKFGSNLLNSMP